MVEKKMIWFASKHEVIQKAELLQNMKWSNSEDQIVFSSKGVEKLCYAVINSREREREQYDDLQAVGRTL